MPTLQPRFATGLTYRAFSTLEKAGLVTWMELRVIDADTIRNRLKLTTLDHLAQIKDCGRTTLREFFEFGVQPGVLVTAESLAAWEHLNRPPHTFYRMVFLQARREREDEAARRLLRW